MLLLAVPGLLAAAGGLWYLQEQGITPRVLAPYIEKRSSGHNPLITGAGHAVSAALLRMDRGDAMPAALPSLSVGAQAAAVTDSGGARKLVGSSEDARRAIASAAPGDVIVFLPGTYRIRGNVNASRPGEEGAPVVVRADRPGTAIIEFDAGEGFKVTAPYWRFENLSIRGSCARQEDCEHAFHVVGGAHHFAAVNNTILDFNAHFKINGEHGRFPDSGLIESNTLAGSAPRRTVGPVTSIDLVAASDWIIRRNLIADFIKSDGDRVSYGAYAKGAGARTRFERNVVLCEQRLRGFPGQRIGLSFGGGGTGKPYCRDHKCVTEHDAGVMQANLVASCSDVGIYVNAAAGTWLAGNTLVDTAGVDVRFPESSVEADGNLVDGSIRSRNGGRLRAGDNLETPIVLSYLGHHPLRSLFAAPGSADFSWREAPPRRVDDKAAADAPPDLCDDTRKTALHYGAFENFRACLVQRR